MWDLQEATVFSQSCSTITKRFPWFNLETENENNLGTFQGETGVLGVPESKMKCILTQSYKRVRQSK